MHSRNQMMIISPRLIPRIRTPSNFLRNPPSLSNGKQSPKSLRVWRVKTQQKCTSNQKMLFLQSRECEVYFTLIYLIMYSQESCKVAAVGWWETDSELDLCHMGIRFWLCWWSSGLSPTDILSQWATNSQGRCTNWTTFFGRGGQCNGHNKGTSQLRILTSWYCQFFF